MKKQTEHAAMLFKNVSAGVSIVLKIGNMGEIFDTFRLRNLVIFISRAFFQTILQCFLNYTARIPQSDYCSALRYKLTTKLHRRVA